jgi:pimeloyl-ACP methyl ester carboxylesterase
MTDFEPTLLHDGLAIYSTGAGEPLLLMPYPHGFGVAPIVQGLLAVILRELKQRVISFDPPGMFNTTHPAHVSMPEMLGCAEEILSTLRIEEPITLVGHSMGGFCAIFANRLDYRARLSEIRVPALIVAGRFDPQAPVLCSEEIARGIPGAQLIIFEHSGHYPSIEERDLFKQTGAEFLA